MHTGRCPVLPTLGRRVAPVFQGLDGRRPLRRPIRPRRADAVGCHKRCRVRMPGREAGGGDELVEGLDGRARPLGAPGASDVSGFSDSNCGQGKVSKTDSGVQRKSDFSFEHLAMNHCQCALDCRIPNLSRRKGRRPAGWVGDREREAPYLAYRWVGSPGLSSRASSGCLWGCPARGRVLDCGGGCSVRGPVGVCRVPPRGVCRPRAGSGRVP